MIEHCLAGRQILWPFEWVPCTQNGQYSFERRMEPLRGAVPSGMIGSCVVVDDPMSSAEVLELPGHKLQPVVVDHRLGGAEVCYVLLHALHDSVCVCLVLRGYSFTNLLKWSTTVKTYR